MGDTNKPDLKRTDKPPGVRKIAGMGVKLVSPDKIKRRVPKSEVKTEA